jgi:hypothetical protein
MIFYTVGPAGLYSLWGRGWAGRPGTTGVERDGQLSLLDVVGYGGGCSSLRPVF